jgi:hypothetical protein
MDLSTDRSEELSAQLATLVNKHRQLDEQVSQETGSFVQTSAERNKLRQLKKMKLQTKDQIAIIEQQLA